MARVTELRLLSSPLAEPPRIRIGCREMRVISFTRFAPMKSRARRCVCQSLLLQGFHAVVVPDRMLFGRVAGKGVDCIRSRIHRSSLSNRRSSTNGVLYFARRLVSGICQWAVVPLKVTVQCTQRQIDRFHDRRNVLKIVARVWFRPNSLVDNIIENRGRPTCRP